MRQKPTDAVLSECPVQQDVVVPQHFKPACNIIGGHRVIEQIVRRRTIRAFSGQRQGLVPILGTKIATTDPHQGYQFVLVVRIHLINLVNQFLPGQLAANLFAKGDVMRAAGGVIARIAGNVFTPNITARILKISLPRKPGAMVNSTVIAVPFNRARTRGSPSANQLGCRRSRLAISSCQSSSRRLQYLQVLANPLQCPPAP